MCKQTTHQSKQVVHDRQTETVCGVTVNLRFMSVEVVLLLIIPLLLSGCIHSPLDEGRIGPMRLPIKIYWDQADVTPQNTTILFYNENGDLYKEWKSSSFPTYAEGSVDLEAGRYTAITFNELRNQIDHVYMQGQERFDTFGAFASPSSFFIHAFALPAGNTPIVYQPGILAASVDTFTVAGALAGCPPDESAGSGLYALSSLHPQRKTAYVYLEVYVKGLKNARMPAVAQLRNMASGYIFSTDRNAQSPVSSQFLVSTRVYDPGQTTDGTVSAHATSFGVPGEWQQTENTPDTRVYLDMAFMLADAQGTVIEYSMDVTDTMEILVNKNNGVTIHIPATLGPLPDIKPVGGNSGFNTELANWDKVIIPITQ